MSLSWLALISESFYANESAGYWLTATSFVHPQRELDHDGSLDDRPR